MSQFRVEKVTKVRGLSDLSEKAKVGEKESTTKRTRGSANINERPSTHGRQASVKKSSSTLKTASSSDTQSAQSKGKSSTTQRLGAPKPTTRTKHGTQNQKTATTKNCSSQQDRQSPIPSTDPSVTKKKLSSHGLIPAQCTRTGALSKPQKNQRETNTNKKTEIKKESSYDASDSDSEKGSVDRLNGDGDFGYETGSYDDSDVSTGELLSPSAKDEKKSILTPQNKENTIYSYAVVEGRPLLITDEVGISTAISGGHVEVSPDEQNKGNHGSYTYAGDEFRSLIITEEVGIAAPVIERKLAMSGGSNSGDGRSELEAIDRPLRQRRVALEYEEVEVTEGSYDRTNIKLTSPPSERINVNSNKMPVSDLYAVVQKKSKNQTNIAEGKSTLSNSQQISAGEETQVKQSPKPTVELADIPPSIPGARKDSNMYEAITGELQNLIMACDDVHVDSKSSEADSSERKVSVGDEKVRPPMPKPYAGPGCGVLEPLPDDSLRVSPRKEMEVAEESSPPIYAIVQKKPKGKSAAEKPVDETDFKAAGLHESPVVDSQPLYAVVQKKPGHHKSLDSLDQLTIPTMSGDDGDSDDDLPPPLPARPADLGDTLKSTHSSEEILNEKPKKSGFNLFKKKHHRQLSDGNVVFQENQSLVSVISPSLVTGRAPQHRRSKSQADVTNITDGSCQAVGIQDSYSEVTLPSNKSRGASDETPPIKPYLEVDITEPPRTPKEFRKETRFFGEGTKGQSVSIELPDGWKEVKSDSGTYYWHVASGTTQWEPPHVATRPKKKSSDGSKPTQEVAERQKVLSFPVHSMGWIELEESQVAPHNMSETISECISTLAQKRNDLWNTSETWGEGKDIRLLLEGDTLKLTESRTKVTMLVQPVSKMRVWGVGKEDHRDFAYVARDPSTGKHKCHMFRCHGNISGRAITSALYEMCSKILEEKKKAQENVKKTSPQKPWSDILNTPPPPSARDHASFNEKPFVESKKSFSAKYVGSVEVAKPTGVDILNKAINKLTSKGGQWRTILIEISVSNIRIIDCSTQELISEDRVRFMSFFGVGKDERLCGYIVSTAPEVFSCHVFQCSPNAATLTRALAEACQLRFQKAIDAHPEIAEKFGAAEIEKARDKSDKDKAGFMTSVQGFLGKLGPKKGVGKKEEGSAPESKQSSGSHPVITCKPSHTFMVKYYGALPVAVGTGIETVEEAAKHLTGGTLLVCQLDVALNGVTLYDSQRSALSKRHFDADTISYCGLTSNRSHFGLIQSMGGGKYICHVFAEYKLLFSKLCETRKRLETCSACSQLVQISQLKLDLLSRPYTRLCSNKSKKIYGDNQLDYLGTDWYIYRGKV